MKTNVIIVILLAVIVALAGGMILQNKCAKGVVASKQEIENRLQALESKMANLEKLTVEFADELALVNVQITAIEDEVTKRTPEPPVVTE